MYLVQLILFCESYQWKFEIMRNHSYILALLFFLLACGKSEALNGQTEAPDHAPWTKLLQQYVNAEGWVDYEGLTGAKVALDDYINILSTNPPSTSWSKEERLAYWLNAYNAFTIKLIVDNYPVESIKDLNPLIAVPFVNTVWQKKWFKIGDEDFSLDNIEHDVLRKEFEEPRIHFAINCASFSCPVLRREAFVADKIYGQLEEQAKLFINDPIRNTIDPQKPFVSKVFSWFKGDFTKSQSLVEFINQYSTIQLDPEVSVRFMDYNWSLNDQKNIN